MIAIIGAMDEEVAAIRRRMTDCVEETVGPVVFVHGQLNHTQVLLFKSGVGLSMAAMSTGLACAHFPLTGIVNIGTAGGLVETQRVLDQVISTQVTYHDLDISVFGNPRSFSCDNRYVFNSDPTFMDKAKSLMGEGVLIGPMVSGHQFISEEKQVETILKYYPSAICVEMEGAAIAHVATQFNLPFIILRSISDLVIHPRNEMSFEAYLHNASERSAQLCFDFVALI